MEGRCSEIERTRLLDALLPQFRPGRLLLLTAGPGTGKTYLVHQLLQHSEGQTASVDFKKISSDINTLVCRLEGVFKELWPDLFSDLMPRNALPFADQASIQANFDFLLDELFLCGDTPAIIVFDGCEVLARRPLWAELISRLLQRFPSFVSIVMLSTVPLRFSPFPKLRSQGRLLELNTEELYFDPSEIHQFLSANAPGISSEHILSAQNKVGGWPAGLSLLCREMRSGDPMSAVDEALPASLHDYLQYEVLANISAEDLNILCTAALLQPFPYELLGKLLSEPQQRLSDVFSSFSFLLEQSVRENHTAVSHFSTIFSEYFTSRAKALLGEQTIQKIHQEAARHFKKEKRTDRALIHLVALEDWASAVKIIINGNHKWSKLEDYETLLFWIDQFPPFYVEQHPAVSILLGKAYLYLGELDSAVKNFSLAHEYARSGSKYWLESGCRLCEVLLLKGYLEEGVAIAEKLVDRSRFISRYKAEASMFQAIGLHLLCRFDECDRLWRHISTVATSRFLPLDQAARSYLMTPKAVFYNLERGEFEESERILDHAITVFRNKDPRKRLGWTLLFKGVLKLELQQQKEAVTWFREAVEISGETNRSVHAGCTAFLSFVLAESGEIDEAKIWHERALPIVSRDLTLWAPVLCALTRAMMTEQSNIVLSELKLAWNLASQRKMLLPLTLTALTAFKVRHKIGHSDEALLFCRQAAAICEKNNVLHREALLSLCSYQLALESGTTPDLNIFCKAMTIISQKELGFLLVNNKNLDGLEMTMQAIQQEINPDYFLKLCNSWGRSASAPLVSVFQTAPLKLKLQISALWAQNCYRPALKHIQCTLKKTKNKTAVTEFQVHVRQLDQSPPDFLRITLFGPFKLFKGEEEITEVAWKRNKAKELFKLFCLYPTTTFTQEYLMDLFWPESSPEKAKVNLWSVVSALKSALEPELSSHAKSNYLQYNNHSYRLQLPAGSTIDTVLFEEKAEQGVNYRECGDNARALICCEIAEELYRDELLPENLYASWCAEQRERFKLLFTKVLGTMAAIYFEQREFGKCIDLYQKITKIDIWDEDSYLLLMQCYVLQGKDLMAVKVFQDCENVFRKELNVTPNYKLQNLSQRILKRRSVIS